MAFNERIAIPISTQEFPWTTQSDALGLVVSDGKEELPRLAKGRMARYRGHAVFLRDRHTHYSTQR
eukprot:5266526-Prorocentrum_lima.AAC.1